MWLDIAVKAIEMRGKFKVTAWVVVLTFLLYEIRMGLDDVWVVLEERTVLSLQEVRKARLSDTCRSVRPWLSRLPWGRDRSLDKFLLDDTSALAYCHIPKVASTWWFRTFAHLYGLNQSAIQQGLEANDIHKLLNDHLQSFKDLPKDAFKVIFVRHPIHRIVSAFTNKFIHIRHPEFITDIQGYVKYFKKEDPHTAITFSNFVDMIIFESNVSQVSYGTLHWMPYYSLCEVCFVDYDFIGTLETFAEDVRYLFRRFQSLQSYSPDLGVKSNAANLDLTRVNELMNQLTLSQCTSLVQLYRFDFEMFGYPEWQCSAK